MPPDRGHARRSRLALIKGFVAPTPDRRRRRTSHPFRPASELHNIGGDLSTERGPLGARVCDQDGDAEGIAETASRPTMRLWK